MKQSLIFIGLALALAACEKKTDDTSATTAASGTTAPVTIADTDLSTPADFEDTAEKAITKSNYKSELSTLEAEIAKE